MPRLALSEQEKRNKTLVATIEFYRSYNKYTLSEIAERLNLSRCTLNTRYKDPQTFTLRELRALANVFNITLTTLIEGKTA